MFARFLFLSGNSLSPWQNESGLEWNAIRKTCMGLISCPFYGAGRYDGGHLPESGYVAHRRPMRYNHKWPVEMLDELSSVSMSSAKLRFDMFLKKKSEKAFSFLGVK